jgi:hypothetical protein
MPNPTSPYGRQQLDWPDLGSDPGSTLHTQITTAIGILSNQVNSRWSGEQTLSDGSTYDIEHNFDAVLANLKIFVIESGVVLSKALQDASYEFTFVDNNTVRVENISGGSKTFQVYVFPSHLNIRATDLDAAIDIDTTGKLSIGGRFAAAQTANVQSGSNVTLGDPDSMAVTLSGAGLASVDGITAPADSKGKVVIYHNNSGGTVQFNDQTGTAANQIYTGTGAPLQLADKASIILRYDTALSKWRVIGSTGGGGSELTITQANSFVAGDLLYFNGTTWAKAQSNALATSAVGMVKQATASNFILVLLGEVSGLSGLTAGSIYYLDASTAGAFTLTQPSAPNFSQPIGVALSTTKMLVKIDRALDLRGPAPTVSTATSLTAGGTITLSVAAHEEQILVGTAVVGGVTLAAAAFGSTAPVNGKKVILIGNSDDNTISLTADITPIAKGLWLNGDIQLGKGKTLTLVYNSTLDAYLELSRNA